MDSQHRARKVNPFKIAGQRHERNGRHWSCHDNTTVPLLKFRSPENGQTTDDEDEANDKHMDDEHSRPTPLPSDKLFSHPHHQAQRARQRGPLSHKPCSQPEHLLRARPRQRGPLSHKPCSQPGHLRAIETGGRCVSGFLCPCPVAVAEPVASVCVPVSVTQAPSQIETGNMPNARNGADKGSGSMGLWLG